METARLSSKGQIVIPKNIRASHGWDAGSQFQVEETEEGVLLRPVRPFPETELRDVLSCTGYKGPRRSLAEMKEAIAEGARRSR